MVSEHPRIGRHVGGAIRQIFVRFGRGGYVIRYRVRKNDIVITRMWHSRENRPPPY